MSNRKRKKDFQRVQSLFQSLNNVVGQDTCEEHNETYDLIETPGGIVGTCPVCWNEAIKKEDEQHIEGALKSKEGWQVPFISQNERVSDDLKEAKINNYKPNNDTQKQAKKMAIEYIRTFDKVKSLVISGNSGIGKSHLAFAIAKALRQQGNKVWFIKTRDLLKMIRTTYNHDAKLTEDYIFDVIETIDCLIIDDLGAEYSKPSDSESWASDMLYAVLDARLNKSTICTTNYTQSELEQKYRQNGDRIKSRMLHKAKAIRLTGEDMRAVNAF